MTRSPALLFSLLLLTAPALVAQNAVTDSSPVTANLSGRVFDYTVRAPLQGATVQLVSSTSLEVVRRTTSNDLGRFDMADLPAGSYLIGFEHPRLDSLLLDAPVSPLVLQAGDRAELTLAIPAVEALYDAWCGDAPRSATGASGSAAAAEAGVLLGRARTPDGRPLADSTRLEVSWRDVVVGPRGVSSDIQLRIVPVGMGGTFAACNLPPDGALSVQIIAGTDSSGMVELDVPATRLLVRDLFLGTGTSQQLLVGRVSAPDSQPVASARVRIAGTTDIALTNQRGVFTLSNAPLGSQTLEVVAIGYEPRRLPVDIVAGTPDTVRVAMISTSNRLERVSVTANSWRAGFDQRRTRSYGQFMDEEEIRRKKPVMIADVFQGVSSVIREPTGSFSSGLKVRATRKNSACTPTVFLDGERVLVQSNDLDALLTVDDLVAVEVYAQPAEVPMQFHSLPFCGAIILWTRKGRP